jgi:tripartite-type tricarboxylate transporter receptor subunit TctC
MGDQVLRQAGLDVQHVPYRGIAPAVTDLITGNVQLMFASPGSVITHVESGTLRFLAAIAPKRLPFLPNIPTTGETGLPPYTTASWWGVVAHSGTPAPIVARLNQLLSEIADDPAMRGRLEKVYMLPLKMSASDMAAQLKADLPVWAKIVKDAGIKPE